QHKIIVELVDDQGRHLICLPEYQAAVFHVAQLPAVIPGLLQAAVKKGRVYHLFLIAGKQAHQYLRLGIDIAPAYKQPLVGKYFYYIAGIYRTVYLSCLVAKYPGMPQ